jgi:hypothetical protein
MFKKLALLIFLIIISSLIYLKFNYIKTDSAQASPKPINVPSPQVAVKTEMVTPESTMLEVGRQKINEEDWAQAQVDWLFKHNLNEEDAQALARLQEQVLDELDEHPQQKTQIQKMFQEKLKKIMGEKKAQDYLKFKGDYDKKIK